MKTKQGISLIVLVITVVVMVILTGAIVLSLNNIGIIEKTTDAVEQSNLATVKELTQMAWLDAYASGERTEEGLNDAVVKTLEDNKVDVSKYIIKVTRGGVKVWLKGNWKQEGLKITNGKVALEIGDSISYDETNGGIITGLTETDWKVLGLSDEGELLIMSTNNIVAYRLGYESTMTDDEEKLKESQNDCVTGIEQLDKECEPYGRGKGATGARSINVEDINKVTGYDPETAKYKNGLTEYGIEITCLYNGTTKPAYKVGDIYSGTLSTYIDNEFQYYNGKEIVTVSDLTAGTVGTAFAKLNVNYYSYYINTLTTSSSDEVKGVGEDTKVYKMLYAQKTYWLASTYITANLSNMGFGMFYMTGKQVFGAGLWSTNGRNPYSNVCGVRAIVSLAPDINITGSSTDGWDFTI